MTKREFSLEILQDHAFKRGGELVSKEYINSTLYLLWRCKLGHKWKASALDVIGKKNNQHQGSWCPKCVRASSTLLSLDDL